MTRSIAIFRFSAPALRPKHPLAVQPPRVIWAILLVGWLAWLGWTAEQIGALVLVFAAASQPQEQS